MTEIEVRVYEAKVTPPAAKATDQQRLDILAGIKEIFAEWLPVLGMDHTSIYVSWADDETRVGSAFARPEYDNLQLTYVPDFLIDPKENPDTEELVLHELVHMFSWAAWAAYDDLIEALICSLELEGEQAKSLRRLNRNRFRLIFEQMTTRITYALLRAAGRDIGEMVTFEPMPCEEEEDGEHTQE